MERSSGTYQGTLRISKRGSPRTRQWLYFAAMRLVPEVRGTSLRKKAKKARDEGDARRLLVAVMRKLAVACLMSGSRTSNSNRGDFLAGSAGAAASRPIAPFRARNQRKEEDGSV